MAHQLAVLGEQWLIEVSQGLCSLVRQRHIDDPAIFLAAQPVDEACPLQPVNQAGNSWYNGNGAAGDLQDGQRLTFATQDAQDVVLRGGSQPIFSQQPGEAYLKLIAGSHDVQGGLLFRRLEGSFLLEFVLQLRGRHRLLRSCSLTCQYFIYKSSSCQVENFTEVEKRITHATARQKQTFLRT